MTTNRFLPSYFLILVVVTLLSGCASLSKQEPTPTEQNKSTPDEQVITRPFPTQSLYSLLVAELAGQRNRYDIFLGNYMQQAHQTRDPNVAERATQIARYLKADQATLDAALLWSDIAPKNAEAQQIAATQLAKAGRVAEAASKIALLLEMGADVQSHNITLMALKTSKENRQEYELEIDKLLLKYPANISLMLSKSLLLQSDGKNEDSLKYINQVLDLDENNFHATILAAKVYEQLDNRAAAIKVLEKALRRNPKNDRIRVQYARLLSTFDTAKAQEQFTLLLSQAPGDPSLILSLALVKKENGLFEEAKKLFEQLLKMDKLASTANYYLGVIAAEEGHTELALSLFEKIQDGPDLFAALASWGKILLKEDKIRPFSQRFEEMRELHPRLEAKLYLLEAELLVEFDKHSIAYDLLSTALESNSMDTNLLYARSMVSEQMDDIPAAEQDLRLIILSQPSSADALNALGYTLANKTDRLQEAKELIERALAIRPDDPAIMDSMGWVEFRMGNYESSLLRLRNAFAEFPDHEVAAHLGEVLWAASQFDEAKKVWQQGLQLSPNSKVIEEVMRRLAPTEASKMFK